MNNINSSNMQFRNYCMDQIRSAVFFDRRGSECRNGAGICYDRKEEIPSEENRTELELHSIGAISAGTRTLKKKFDKEKETVLTNIAWFCQQELKLREKTLIYRVNEFFKKYFKISISESLRFLSDTLDDCQAILGLGPEGIETSLSKEQIKEAMLTTVQTHADQCDKDYKKKLIDKNKS